MKSFALDVFSTTILALLILAIFDYASPFHCIPLGATTLQIFGANIAIHLGLKLTHKFTHKYFVLEHLLDIAYVVIVLGISSEAFHWFGGWFNIFMRIGILTAMAVAIYYASLYFRISQTRKEIKQINELIKIKKKKS